VAISIYDGNERIASANGDNVELKIENAKLWSADHPNLYKAVVELKKNGKTMEKQEKPFGIREISWSAQGFKVNGQEVLLKGGCLHHDNGILGAAEYDDAAYRKVAIMKEYGFNAIRSSHNPLSEAMLKACDELGMYVVDELWDMWYITKTKYDYSKDFYANYQKDIYHFVKKDFNHPSVVMYSIGNEVAEPYEEKGVELAKELVSRLHQADSTRPVTAGINLMIIFARGLGMDVFAQEFDESSKEEPKEMSSEQYNQMMEASSQQMLQAVVYPPADTATTPVLDALDIAGYNYASLRYPLEGSLHPNRIVVGSETFPHQLAENWAMVEKFPYVIGDFMWTAWDYLGEVNIGGWLYSDDANITNKVYPWKLSGAGALDLIGNPTGEALLAKAVWLKDNKPYIGVRPIHMEQLFKSQWRGTNSIPSWSWRGCEGMQTVVEVFTSAQKVKLYLNDKLIGEQEVNNHLASFDVTYEPGTLKAVSIDANGKEYEQILMSATGKVKVSIEPEKENYKVGELAFVNINLVGENGIVESKADRKLTVAVEGGELLGFGSQALVTEASFRDGKYPSYYGQSQAVIRSLKPGIVKIHVVGEGVEGSYELCIKK
jgi:beta-galactosidase